MKLLLILSVTLLQLNSIFAQPLPANNFSNESRKIINDAGKNWELLTNFNPIRYGNLNQTPSKKPKYFRGYLGINGNSRNSLSFDGYGYFMFKNKFYAYISPKYFPEINLSGQSTQNQKHISGIGFKNDWVILQIGNGRESWGAGNEIQLALSENSFGYDYFLLGSDYGKIRVRYIHGFLEKIDLNINRYLTARGIEWTNRETLVLGFSETVIYSGVNRSLDLGYLNPISSHLEIELNNRLNNVGNDNSNAVWQLHLDYLLKSYDFRLSLNYLIDELVLDPAIESQKENGKGFSIRIAYTPSLNYDKMITLHGSLIHIGTPTFRHINGENNFVHNGKPLGWNRGSDTKEKIIGINYLQKKFLATVSISFFQIGEESITQRIFEPYADYLIGPFPSGKVDKGNYTKIKLFYKLNRRLTFNANLYGVKKKSEKNLTENSIEMGIQFQI